MSSKASSPQPTIPSHPNPSSHPLAIDVQGYDSDTRPRIPVSSADQYAQFHRTAVSSQAGREGPEMEGDRGRVGSDHPLDGTRDEEMMNGGVQTVLTAKSGSAPPSSQPPSRSSFLPTRPGTQDQGRRSQNVSEADSETGLLPSISHRSGQTPRRTKDEQNDRNVDPSRVSKQPPNFPPPVPPKAESPVTKRYSTSIPSSASANVVYTHKASSSSSSSSSSRPGSRILNYAGSSRYDTPDPHGLPQSGSSSPNYTTAPSPFSASGSGPVGGGDLGGYGLIREDDDDDEEMESGSTGTDYEGGQRNSKAKGKQRMVFAEPDLRQLREEDDGRPVRYNSIGPNGLSVGSEGKRGRSETMPVHGPSSDRKRSSKMRACATGEQDDGLETGGYSYSTGGVDSPKFVAVDQASPAGEDEEDEVDRPEADEESRRIEENLRAWTSAEKKRRKVARQNSILVTPITIASSPTSPNDPLSPLNSTLNRSVSTISNAVTGLGRRGSMLLGLRGSRHGTSQSLDLKNDASNGSAGMGSAAGSRRSRVRMKGGSMDSTISTEKGGHGQIREEDEEGGGEGMEMVSSGNPPSSSSRSVPRISSGPSNLDPDRKNSVDSTQSTNTGTSSSSAATVTATFEFSSDQQHSPPKGGGNGRLNIAPYSGFSYDDHGSPITPISPFDSTVSHAQLGPPGASSTTSFGDSTPRRKESDESSSRTSMEVMKQRQERAKRLGSKFIEDLESQKLGGRPGPLSVVTNDNNISSTSIVGSHGSSPIDFSTSPAADLMESLNSSVLITDSAAAASAADHDRPQPARNPFRTRFRNSGRTNSTISQMSFNSGFSLDRISTIDNSTQEGGGGGVMGGGGIGGVGFADRSTRHLVDTMSVGMDASGRGGEVGGEDEGEDVGGDGERGRKTGLGAGIRKVSWVDFMLCNCWVGMDGEEGDEQAGRTNPME